MNEENTHNLTGRSFEERVMARFDAMDKRFDSIDRRFNAIDKRLDAMDQRLNAMDQRFDAMEQRVDAMEARFDARFDGVESRLDRLEAREYDTKPIWERALAEIAEVKERIETLTTDINARLAVIDSKFDIVIQDVFDVRAQQRELRKRVDRLEST